MSTQREPSGADPVAAIYRRALPQVYGYLLPRCGSTAVASDIVTGVGVRQILLEDPSGNLVELFEPLAGYHERPPTPTGWEAPDEGPESDWGDPVTDEDDGQQ